MIKPIAKQSLLAAALAASLGLVAGTASAADSAYWSAADSKVWKDGSGKCWCAGYWTPAMATEECHPDLVKKPAPPPPAPAPAPAAPPPPPPPKPTIEKMTFSADALFDFDKAVLRPEGRAKLDDLAGKVKDVKLEVIIAVGHADRIGNDGYNQRLSERRAAAVKDYLVTKGIEANRIYTEGKGEKQPKTTPDQCKGLGKESAGNKKLVSCLQPDRRVEIEVVGTKEVIKQ